MKSVVTLLNWLRRLGRPASPVPVLALATLAMLHVQLLRSIHDVDIFWQILFGNLTLKDGLPTHEPLLAHQQHQPLAAFYWLGQVLYALAFQLGDWPLLRLADAVVWLGGFFVLARHCARRLGNAWPATLALWLGWFAALPFASLRLQSFGVLGFGLFIALIRSDRRWRVKLPVGFALLLVWQNLHPSVIVAVVYLGSRAAAAFGTWVVTSAPAYLRYAAKREMLFLLIMVALAGFAIICTPVGFDIFRLSAYNGAISKHLGITEWQPMWACEWINNGRDSAWIGLNLAMVIIVVTLLSNKKSLRLSDVLPMIAFTIMSVYCHRFILLWGVVVIPVIAECLQSWKHAFDEWLSVLTDLSTVMTPRRMLVRRLLMLAAVLPAVVWPLAERPAPFADYYPFAAVNALQARPFRGVIFNDYFWGGAISFHGYPDWQPTHDGRYYLFPQSEWDRYFDVIGKGRMPLADLDREYHPDAFFLRKGIEPYGGLITLLRKSPQWTVLFEDWQSIIFLRRP